MSKVANARPGTQLAAYVQHIAVELLGHHELAGRIASDLRPVVLDDHGVVPALESFGNDLSARTGILIAFNSENGEVDLREPHATALYRMVQEALPNVARHANASSVALEIRSTQDLMLVRVQDDGRGLNPEPICKSFGVLGIRERAARSAAKHAFTGFSRTSQVE